MVAQPARQRGPSTRRRRRRSGQARRATATARRARGRPTTAPGSPTELRDQVFGRFVRGSGPRRPAPRRRDRPRPRDRRARRGRPRRLGRAGSADSGGGEAHRAHAARRALRAPRDGASLGARDARVDPLGAGFDPAYSSLLKEAQMAAAHRCSRNPLGRQRGEARGDPRDAQARLLDGDSRR